MKNNSTTRKLTRVTATNENGRSEIEDRNDPAKKKNDAEDVSNEEENPEKEEKNEEVREENGRRGQKIIEEGKTYQLINQVINNNNNVNSRDLLFLRKDNVFRRTFRRTILYINGKPLVKNFVNLHTQKLFERNEIPV